MPTKYVHTNIISEDWMSLSDFYIKVFNCKPVPPKRDISDEWLAIGTGIPKAHLQGIHLLLPGHGEDGPTLEIYTYYPGLKNTLTPAANRKGLGHLAFRVDNVEHSLNEMIRHGGKRLGEIVSHEVEGVGLLTFTYATDPEGNIIEIQNWT